MHGITTHHTPFHIMLHSKLVHPLVTSHMQCLSKKVFKVGFGLFYLLVGWLLFELAVGYKLRWNCYSICGQPISPYPSELDIPALPETCRTNVTLLELLVLENVCLLVLSALLPWIAGIFGCAVFQVISAFAVCQCAGHAPSKVFPHFGVAPRVGVKDSHSSVWPLEWSVTHKRGILRF